MKMTLTRGTAISRLSHGECPTRLQMRQNGMMPTTAAMSHGRPHAW